MLPLVYCADYAFPWFKCAFVTENGMSSASTNFTDCGKRYIVPVLIIERSISIQIAYANVKPYRQILKCINIMYDTLYG